MQTLHSPGMFLDSKRRSWMRPVTAFLVVTHLLSLQPVMVWAASPENPKFAPAAPPPAITFGPAIPSPVPSTVRPDDATLQREEDQFQRMKQVRERKDDGEAKRTPKKEAKVKVKETPRVPGDFSENPSDKEITNCGVLPWRPVPFGVTQMEENRDLAKALVVHQAAYPDGDVAALERFLAAWPESAWRSTVLLTIASLYKRDGFSTRAVSALKSAWSQAREAKTIAQRRICDAVLGELSTMLVQTGQYAESDEVIREASDKSLILGAGERVGRAKTISEPRQADPARYALCGVEAVMQWFLAVHPNQPLPVALTESTERIKYGVHPGSGEGLDLDQVQHLAQAVGLKCVAVHGTDFGKLPVPAVLHWKRGHFAAVSQKAGNRFKIATPSGDTPIWMTIEAMQEECSGYALIPEAATPVGWERVSAMAARKIKGADGPGSYYSPTASTPDCKECEENSSGACSSCDGMPVHSIYFAKACFGIFDIPARCQPAYGVGLDVKLSYFSRIQDPQLSVAGSVGTNWTLPWFAYLKEEMMGLTSSGVVEDPPGVFTETVSLSGTIKVFMPGGGSESHQITGPTYVWSSEDPDTYLCPNGIPIVARGFESHDEIVRVGGQAYVKEWDPFTIWGYSCLGVYQTPPPVEYQRKFPDGTVYHFGKQVGFDGFFLTQIDYPDASTQVFSYDEPTVEHPEIPFRLKTITGPAEGSVTLYYEDPNDDLLITKIELLACTDTSGKKTVLLSYDDSGRLVTIVDAVGMVSRFDYNGEVINSMTTPYGVTKFEQSAIGDPQWVEVTYPNGAKERAERRVGTNPALAETDPNPPNPAVMAVRNGALAKRNTFFWDRRAMASMTDESGNVTLDYTKAKVYHWLYNPASNEMPSYVSSEKNALEGRVWYLYDGSSQGDLVGGNAQATSRGRVLEDLSTQVWKYEYNFHGHVTKVTDPIGRITESEYLGPNSNITKIKQKIASGYETLASFQDYNADPANPSDNLVASKIVDASGQSAVTDFDLHARRESVTRVRNGVSEVTSYTYYGNTANANAYRLWKITSPAPQNAILQTFTYDAGGNLSTVTDVDGYTVQIYYDKLDRELRRVYPDGSYEQVIYSKLNVEWQRDREGRWTHTEYNALQQAVATTDPLGRKTQFDWCGCGALDGITDAAGSTTTFTRDLQGRMTSKIYADSKGTTYEYGERSGRLKWVKDARNQRTNFEYYADNNLSKVSYTDQNGASLLQTRADGTKINATVDWTYDTAYNRVATMIDGTGTTTYAYVPVNPADTTYGDGKLLSMDGSAAGDTISYVYDEYSRPKQRDLNASANSMTRIFDALGRTTSETNPLGAFTYAYVGNSGRLAEVTNGSGFRSVYEYYGNVATGGTGDGDKRLSAIKHYSSTSTLNLRFDYHYTPSGNINQWTQAWGAALTAGHDFVLGYDTADQLLGAEDRQPGSPSTVQKRYGYAYDLAANRTLEQIGTPSTNGLVLTRATHNNLNQVTSRTGSSGQMAVEGTVNEPAQVTIAGQAASPFWLKSAGVYGFKGSATVTAGTNNIAVQATDAGGNVSSTSKTVNVSGTSIPTLTYDDAGNMLTDGTSTYTWDASNQLVNISRSSGTLVTEFTYDGLGRRTRIVEKTSGIVQSEKRFVWEGIAIAEERNSSNTVTQRFFGQGELEGSTQLLYRRDHLGSVRELVNTSGTMQSRYEYDLWGRRTKLSGTPDADMALTALYIHAATSLYLAPYRGYSAELGRWLNRDPMETVLALSGKIYEPELYADVPNLYSYLGNGVIDKIDMSGLLGGNAGNREGPNPRCCQIAGGTLKPRWQALGVSSASDCADKLSAEYRVSGVVAASGAIGGLIARIAGANPAIGVALSLPGLWNAGTWVGAFGDCNLMVCAGADPAKYKGPWPIL